VAVEDEGFDFPSGKHVERSMEVSVFFEDDGCSPFIEDDDVVSNDQDFFDLVLAVFLSHE